MTVGRVAGVVLAAGRSARLGTPKQLLPYGDTTVLGATVAVARSCGFDQLIVTLGHGADAVRVPVQFERGLAHTRKQRVRRRLGTYAARQHLLLRGR